jgi:hypothetical protein
LYSSFSLLPPVTRPAHLILLDWRALIISREKHK